MTENDELSVAVESSPHTLVSHTSFETFVIEICPNELDRTCLLAVRQWAIRIPSGSDSPKTAVSCSRVSDPPVMTNSIA